MNSLPKLSISLAVFILEAFLTRFFLAVSSNSVVTVAVVTGNKGDVQ